MNEFIPKELPINIEISHYIYKKLISASRTLSELNSFAKIIPNRNILINALVLQEAKDSSEIENIITTHDELFLVKIDESKITQEAKSETFKLFKQRVLRDCCYYISPCRDDGDGCCAFY